MIVLAVSLALATPPIAAQTADNGSKDDAIIVIGEKLKRWSAKLKKKDGQLVCKIKKSTGDAAIDRIGCDAMTTCFPSVYSEENIVAFEALPKSERKAKQRLLNKQLTSCVFDSRATMIDELAELRAAE
ncbi:MAG: hypothetical protein V3V15_08400 [Sphingorhabdus sp.]